MSGPEPSTTPVPDATPPDGVAQAPKPDLGLVLRTQYRLILRTIATPGRLVAVGALAAVGVFTAMLIRVAGPTEPIEAGVGFVNANVATLIPVAVLVFGAAALGDLIDDGSLVYLWLRPIPSWVPVVAAWAATVTVVVPLVLLPVMASTLIIAPSATLLAAALTAGLVAIVAYAAVFVMLGVRFRRALPWGLVYILIWEGFVASAGDTASKLALRSYVRSILSVITDTSLKLGDFSLATGIVVPLLVAAAALAYAARRLANTDVA